jgi:hypothetical protein
MRAPWNRLNSVSALTRSLITTTNMKMVTSSGEGMLSNRKFLSSVSASVANTSSSPIPPLLPKAAHKGVPSQVFENIHQKVAGRQRFYKLVDVRPVDESRTDTKVCTFNLSLRNTMVRKCFMTVSNLS